MSPVSSNPARTWLSTFPMVSPEFILLFFTLKSCWAYSSTTLPLFQCPISVIVAWPVLVGNVLVLDGRLQHHSLSILIDQTALDFLPRRLAFRHVRQPAIRQLGSHFFAPLRQFLIPNQNVRFTPVQVDPHPVARPDQRQTAARRRFRRSVQDRG